MGRPFAVSTLSQAANGRTLPSLAVTRAYVLACGGSMETAVGLWRRANIAASSAPERLSSQGLLRPGPSATASEFVARLRALRKVSGLSFREIEHRAKHRDVLGSVLPRSSVSDMLSQERLPRYDILMNFVAICLEECIARGHLAPEFERSVRHEWATAWRSLTDRLEQATDQTVAEDTVPAPRTSGTTPGSVYGQIPAIPAFPPRPAPEQIPQSAPPPTRQPRRPRWKFWALPPAPAEA
ncbi:hypothetical protein [Streptomyces tauricus]|uniref:hypothetical protein n=1 Tax=Streptomyces tauricus TaxID=68274 RepID=UPI0022443A8E|nr:hypothetical protein [Streptomyces tauricus]